MRCIDADAFINRIVFHTDFETDVKELFEDEINAEPTIEPERKKGEWEMVSQHENPPTYIYSCSECRHKSFGFYNYCPNCGADMREGAERRTDDR